MIVMKTKRILLAALTVVCAMTMFTSCTREDNPVTPTNGKAVVTVNNAALYEELNLADQMPGWLEKWATVIRDSVLIYDQGGMLVRKVGGETGSLQPIAIETGYLPNGTYTLVVWQTILLPDGRMAWHLEGEDCLATVSLYAEGGCIGFFSAVGCAVATVAIDGGDIQANVSPKSLGSIVEMRIDNFSEDKGYKSVFLYNSYPQYIVGCHLDPSLSDEERWIWDDLHYWDEGIGYVDLTMSYSKFFTMAHGDNLEFQLDGQKIDGSSQYLSNTVGHLGIGENAIFHCDMDCFNWQPCFFGYIEDFEAWKAERDEGILEVNPCLDWGCSLDQVQRHIKANRWWVAIDETPKRINDHQWGVSYYIAPGLVEVYVFATDDGNNLSRACVDCLDPNLTLDMINSSLLKQGYVYKGKITFPGGTPRDIFYSADGKIEVQIIVKADRLRIDYQPTDPNDDQYITPADEVPGGIAILR